jgi:hypothetical protein
MAINYVRALATATRLISENGRAITVERSSATLDDVNRPWGPKEATGGESISTTGLFLDLERSNFQAVTASLGLAGSNVQAKRQRILVPAAAALPEEVGPNWQVTDAANGQTYEIFLSKPFKPGGILIFYIVEVSL